MPRQVTADAGKLRQVRTDWGVRLYGGSFLRPRLSSFLDRLKATVEQLEVIAMLVLGVVAGCGETFCHLLWCTSGLTIAFSKTPTSPFHIEATVDGTGSYCYDCPDVTRCNTMPTLSGFTPGHALITVSYQGRSASTEVTPVYHETYPNGKDCGGAHTQATVSVPLP